MTLTKNNLFQSRATGASGRSGPTVTRSVDEGSRSGKGPVTRPNPSMVDLDVMDLPFRRSPATRFVLQSTETGPHGPPGQPAAQIASRFAAEAARNPLPLTEADTARARTG